MATVTKYPLVLSKDGHAKLEEEKENQEPKQLGKAAMVVAAQEEAKL